MQPRLFTIPNLLFLFVFVIVCGLFLAVARRFARRSTELRLVALALAIVTPATILLSSLSSLMWWPVTVGLEFEQVFAAFYYGLGGVSYAGSVALAVIWWHMKGRPQSLNTLVSVHPTVHPLWVVAIPISGGLLWLVALSLGSPLYASILIPVIQLAFIGLLGRRLTVETGPAQPVFAKPTLDSALSQHEPFIPLQRPAPTATPPAPLPTTATPEQSEPLTVASPVARRQKIFLSYRREDSADVAGRIYDRLVHKFGKEQIFKDVDSIPLGVDFRKHLAQMVGSCDILLAVIGNNWQTADRPDGQRRLDDPKDFVRIELESTLQRDIPVIPVLVRGADIPDESNLPTTLATLAYRNGIAVRADPDFHRDMDRLIEGVQSHLASLS
jgi:hypothetical protein